MPKHASVTEARDLQQHGSTYVDVRSRAEFEAGHPEGALNVPLLDRDARTGQAVPNPDFVTVMQTVFPPDTKLLLGCQVGGRSMRAAMILESFGFADVTNVTGGFGGWGASGLPVEQGAPEGRRYEDLAAKAGVDV